MTSDILRSFPRKRESSAGRKELGPRLRGDERNLNQSAGFRIATQPLRGITGTRRWESYLPPA